MSVTAPTISDPSVPGLRIALEPTALMELLAEQLPEAAAGTRVVDAQIYDVQYTPGSGARVLYKIACELPESSRKGRQLVAVRALRRSEAMPAAPTDLIRRYEAVRAGSRSMPRTRPLRTPWLAVPSAGILVSAFPLDPELPTLMDVTDPRFMTRALQRAWPPQRRRVLRVAVAPMSYTPSARVALRYEIESEHRDTGEREVRRLVGKLDHRRSPARLFPGHWAVWKAVQGRVAMATPAGYLAVPRLSLQDFIEGTRVSDLAGTADFERHLCEAARSIAQVHALRLPLLAQRDDEKELSSVSRWARVLAKLRPEHAARIERLRARLQRELAGRMRVTGTVHADFHLANMLAVDDRVALIDWDQTAHGDPMVDVGRALASLRVSSLRVNGTVDGFHAAGEAFLETYLRCARDDERRARLFESASLLIAAAGPFRLQREGWQQSAELMLDEVECTLELSLAGPWAPGMLPSRKSRVPFRERGGWATDASYVRALLVRVVHDVWGDDIELTECEPRLVRENRELRQVRWHLRGYRGDARWRGTLEGIGYPDSSGLGLLARLDQAAKALDGRPDVLRLPIPLGHLGPLAMLVYEPPRGDVLLGTLGTEREAAAMTTFAAALARLNALDFGIAKERGAARDIRSLERRIARLAKRRRHPDGQLAGAVFERLAPRLRAAGQMRGTVVRGLEARWVRMSEGGPAVASLWDLVVSDPRAAFGDVLAQVHEAVLRRGVGHSAPETIRRAYAEASGVAEADLATFEVAGLLHRAYHLLRSEPKGRVADRLLRLAHTFLEVEV